MSRWSRQSLRTVRTQRSATAFTFGALQRCFDHAHAFGTDDLVERTAELRVSVVDQEPHLPVAVVKLHQ